MSKDTLLKVWTHADALNTHKNTCGKSPKKTAELSERLLNILLQECWNDKKRK